MKSLWYDKYFATAHPSTTKRNIVNIKQLSLYDLALLQYVICSTSTKLKKIFLEEYENKVYNLRHSWLLFKMIELTKNMRQKDDQPFTELLTKFRTAWQTEGDIQCIQSWLVHPEGTDYPVSIFLYFWDSFFCISCLFFISLNCFFSKNIFFSAGSIALCYCFFPTFNHQFFSFLSINYFTWTCTKQYSVFP